MSVKGIDQCRPPLSHLAVERFSTFAAMAPPALPDDPLDQLQVRLHRRGSYLDDTDDRLVLLAIGATPDAAHLPGDVLRPVVQLATNNRLALSVLVQDAREATGQIPDLLKTLAWLADSVLYFPKRPTGLLDQHRRSCVALEVRDVLRALYTTTWSIEQFAHHLDADADLATSRQGEGGEG